MESSLLWCVISWIHSHSKKILELRTVLGLLPVWISLLSRKRPLLKWELFCMRVWKGVMKCPDSVMNVSRQSWHLFAIMNTDKPWGVLCFEASNSLTLFTGKKPYSWQYFEQCLPHLTYFIWNYLFKLNSNGPNSMKHSVERWVMWFNVMWTILSLVLQKNHFYWT